jgi:hypothetical protein
MSNKQIGTCQLYPRPRSAEAALNLGHMGLLACREKVGMGPREAW